MSDYRPVVSIEETIDAAPTKVWETATKKTGVMFMGADVETDWKEGHPITFKGKWQGKSFEDKGKVETVEEGRRLAFTHFSPASGKQDVPENYNLVSIELTSRGKGTDVTLTQSMHGDAAEPSPEMVSEFEKNWRMMLGKLKEATEQR